MKGGKRLLKHKHHHEEEDDEESDEDQDWFGRKHHSGHKHHHGHHEHGGHDKDHCKIFPMLFVVLPLAIHMWNLHYFAQALVAKKDSEKAKKTTVAPVQ